MKFKEYLTESFEDKLFTLIDEFMQDKNVEGKDLLDTDTWKNLIGYLGDKFSVPAIQIRGPNILDMLTKKPDISGASSVEGIIVDVPDGPLTKKLRAGILSTLFHEMAHQLQIKEAKPDFMKNYFPGGGGMMGYVVYFLQSIERPAQAIGAAVIAAFSGKDVMADLEKVKSNALKAKTGEEMGQAIRSVLSEYSKMPVYMQVTMENLFTVCNLIHGMHLQIIPKEQKEKGVKLKNELINKWSRFEKNFENSYKKFHGYFKRYNISI